MDRLHMLMLTYGDEIRTMLQEASQPELTTKRSAHDEPF
jgi:hypothetical protein